MWIKNVCHDLFLNDHKNKLRPLELKTSLSFFRTRPILWVVHTYLGVTYVPTYVYLKWSFHHDTIYFSNGLCEYD